MKWLVGLLVPLFLIILSGCSEDSSSPLPYTYKSNGAIVGIETSYTTVEGDELNATLAELGCTVVDFGDPTAEVVISAPGFSASAQVGIPYIQISDHGSDIISNNWAALDANTSVQITLLGSHPITTGVNPTWTTYGFWLYGTVEEYVGWGTSATQVNLANVLTTDAGSNIVDQNGTLAIDDTNTSVYIGWNVYGSRATLNDKKVLDNSIAFLTGRL